MARLAPVRDELLRGDIRSLYIGWLAAVTGEMMDDDAWDSLLSRAEAALAEYKDLLESLEEKEKEFIAQREDLKEQNTNLESSGDSDKKMP